MESIWSRVTMRSTRISDAPGKDQTYGTTACRSYKTSKVGHHVTVFMYRIECTFCIGTRMRPKRSWDQS